MDSSKCRARLNHLPLSRPRHTHPKPSGQATMPPYPHEHRWGRLKQSEHPARAQPFQSLVRAARLEQNESREGVLLHIPLGCGYQKSSWCAHSAVATPSHHLTVRALL